MADLYTSAINAPSSATAATAPSAIATVLARLPASAVTRLIDALPADLQQALAARVRQFDDGTGQTRRRPRRKAGRAGLVIFNDGANFTECTVLDVTEEGCRLRVEDAYALPRFFTLQVQGQPERWNCGVRWRSTTELGVKFILA
jgi:hypothetical protein